jgi:CIC family chloride channel protein
VLVGAGILYVKCFYGVHDFFKKLKIPNHIKPAIGGLLTGLIGLYLPQTLSFGYGYAQDALNNQLSTYILFGIAFGKILTTSFSIGSGGSGGVFGPSVVIGGTLGGGVGRVFNQLLPNIVTHPGAYVVVGMAGFFTVVSNAPISTIIFVSEMTNSYHLLLPSFLVCLIGYVLSRKWTIYIKQVPSKIDSNAHRGEFFIDVLEEIKVRDMTPYFSKYTTVPENMHFSQFKQIFSDSSQHYFPVVDDRGRMTGIFSINDIRGVLFEQEIDDVVLMRDIGTTDIIFTTPSDDLNEVLKKFTVRNIQSIPVVEEDDHSSLIGMLERREVINVYNKRIAEIKTSEITHDKTAIL